MLKVEDYARIRRAYRDGMSIREIARTFHHSRHKIREALRDPQPGRYTRSKCPLGLKLSEVYQQLIEEILQADEQAPPKQRHTAVAIYRRLVGEGYQGGYDQVRRYVGRRRLRDRETFIPLSHDPGQRAECDFGHIYADFPEGRRLVSVLITTWAWSNATFAIALPTEKIEAILHGTVEAFRFFGSVPKELWWDNPKTVAKVILKGRERRLNEHYLALASHYNFEPLFCLPARGNEKPHVENRVKFMQRGWATPVPQVADLEELNQLLRARCVEDQERVVAGQSETIGRRLAEERERAIPLPDREFDAAVACTRKVDKYQTVAFEKNRYSVPRRYAFRTVTVKAYVDHLEIFHEHQPIARHARCYEQGKQVLDPLHYLVTLERKPACLDHTAVYRDWRLPAEFAQLRDELEARHGRLAGAREYIRVLQLLAEHPTSRVCQAIMLCRRRSTLSAQAIRHEAARLATPRKSLPDNEGGQTHTCLVQVPLPDLSKFDRLLRQGGQSHGQDSRKYPGSPALVEDESETTSPADNVGRVHQVGPGSSRDGPGLFGILAAADGIGGREPRSKRASGTHQTGWVSSLQGLGHV